MDVDVPGLADAEGPVGGLVLHRRVPPPVVVDHVVGPGQVEAGATGLEGQDEDLRAVGGVLETLRHQVPLFPGDAAVEEGGFKAVVPFQ